MNSFPNNAVQRRPSAYGPDSTSPFTRPFRAGSGWVGGSPAVDAEVEAEVDVAPAAPAATFARLATSVALGLGVGGTVVATLGALVTPLVAGAGVAAVGALTAAMVIGVVAGGVGLGVLAGMYPAKVMAFFVKNWLTITVAVAGLLTLGHSFHSPLAPAPGLMPGPISGPGPNLQQRLAVILFVAAGATRAWQALPIVQQRLAWGAGACLATLLALHLLGRTPAPLT